MAGVRDRLLTNGLNPKATLFFLSLFTVVISPDTPLLVQAGYGLYLAGATALWFLLVAAVQPRPRAGWLCAHGALVRSADGGGADRPRRSRP